MDDLSSGMRRRAFLQTAAGAAGTYALVVKAGGASAQPAADSAVRFESIAPGGDARAGDEPSMQRVDLDCDLCVAGGGMAGVCAALAAARHGLKVILVQDRSRLGGNASSEVRMHIVGADCHGNRPGWREGGILEEIRLEYAARNPHFAWEMWDLLLYDKVVSEPNITLLLDSVLYRAEVRDGAVAAVMVRCDKTEHLYRIAARYFADCTGDCRLGLEAGAILRTGHESRSEFGESLAPEQAGPETLGSSILFTSKDYGKPMPYAPPAWARKVVKEQLQFRSTNSWDYGFWWIEWGGHLDTIRDNERIRYELLSIVLGVWDYVKNSGNHPESANWAMDWIGMVPGKRGSRRIEGAHMLSQVDCEGGWKAFHDGVSIGGWSFDNHPPGGFDATAERPAVQIDVPEPYNVPLRSLYSSNVANLFMAGRNISATHVAFTSTRVMATCAVQGQAIGTAAAVCAAASLTPAALAADHAKVAALQQTLIRDDQTIRAVRNNDPLDLARSAKVAASATVPDSDPENVLTGETRDRVDPMVNPWTHRWGCPMGGEVWLALEWDAPQTIGHIQLTFDSGFHRELTLTERVSYQNRIVKGPQPEVVRDYRVEADAGDGRGFVEVVRVEGNVQRLRRHSFPPVDAKSIRIRIDATNGADTARIYEVRCYREAPRLV